MDSAIGIDPDGGLIEDWLLSKVRGVARQIYRKISSRSSMGLEDIKQEIWLEASKVDLLAVLQFADTVNDRLEKFYAFANPLSTHAKINSGLSSVGECNSTEAKWGV